MPVNARNMTGTSRDRQGQGRDKQGQGRDKHGQAGTNRDSPFLSLLVLLFPVCPCLSLPVPVCPCMSLSVPVRPYLPVCPCLSLPVPACPCLSLSVPVWPCLYIFFPYVSTFAKPAYFPLQMNITIFIRTNIIRFTLLFYFFSLACSRSLLFNQNSFTCFFFKCFSSV